MNPSNPYQPSSKNANYQSYQPVYNSNLQQHQPGYAYQVYVPSTANQAAAYRSFIAPPNNSHKLQEGCYPCYKVILSLFFIGYLIALGCAIYTAIQDPYLHIIWKIIGIVIYLIPAILLVCQLQAISNRNLPKAKDTLCGLIVYVLGYMLYVFSVAAYYGNVQNVDMFVYRSIALMVTFLILVVYGSCKVVKVLEKTQNE